MTQHLPQPCQPAGRSCKLHKLLEKRLGSALAPCPLGFSTQTLAFTDVPRFGQSQFSHLHPEPTRRPAWAGALPKQRLLLLWVKPASQKPKFLTHEPCSRRMVEREPALPKLAILQTVSADTRASSQLAHHSADLRAAATHI